MRRLLMCLIVCIACACEKEAISENCEYLPEIKNVSLNHHGQNVRVSLPFNGVIPHNINAKTKYGSYWIQRLECDHDLLTFYAVENNEYDRGYRSDTVYIYSGQQEIGKFCVVQARNYISPKEMKWALPESIMYNEPIGENGMTGLELTRVVYELKKTTNGKDSYKNYPAFAYCIDMNIDPQNNMEWHLPSIEEMYVYRGNRQDFMESQFAEHDIWWSADGGETNVYVVQRATVATTVQKKNANHWVMAFRNGEMEPDIH
ncbi:MAG: hypothetical protein IJZ78_05505 [Alistipes sp.]|nr:hypothetical protein [Alistipes sp.]